MLTHVWPGLHVRGIPVQWRLSAGSVCSAWPLWPGLAVSLPNPLPQNTPAPADSQAHPDGTLAQSEVHSCLVDVWER